MNYSIILSNFGLNGKPKKQLHERVKHLKAKQDEKQEKKSHETKKSVNQKKP